MIEAITAPSSVPTRNQSRRTDRLRSMSLRGSFQDRVRPAASHRAMTAASSESRKGRTCMANSGELACHRTVAAVSSPSRPAKRRFDRPSVVLLIAFASLYALAAALRGGPSWLGLLYAGASALSFALYAVDKAAAIDKRDRIPESMLLSLGLVGGWPGAIVAQQVLRHKT